MSWKPRLDLVGPETNCHFRAGADVADIMFRSTSRTFTAAEETEVADAA